MNERQGYSFYSNILKKPFDTVEALIEAENAELEKQEAKLKKSQDKKVDAAKVEAAFKAVNAAKKAYEAEILEAQKASAKIIADAKAAYAKAVEAARTKLDVIEGEYNTAIKEFTAKYPEGYHMTFKDGDTMTSISRGVYESMIHNFYDSLLKFFD